MSYSPRIGLDEGRGSSSAIMWPTETFPSPKATLADVYESYVLTTSKLKTFLPARTYQELQRQMKSSRIIDSHLADVVAHAAKEWAISLGATHFTHVFQPLTGGSAEKQDSFLSFSKQSFDELGKPHPINSFTGSQLLQSEPDASSFPHGGIRSTFEARGYTIWESSSPLYLYPGPLNTKVLCIPSIFISYDGKVLDEKTILLRSEETLNKSSVEILKLLGVNNVECVKSNLGVEQEFFLVNKSVFEKRMDLKLTGSTLFGKVPPKHQQLDDHYFKRVPDRELTVIAEAELMLCKLGIPCKTRHSEVAPRQFEMAPIFEPSSLASDHNVLTMAVLKSVANKYNMEVLFSEKPFRGVNGSGKHCNWSISTNTGINLLDPGDKPLTNVVFLTFLAACLDAVHKYGDLLLASITSSTNRHRLGASEAPPGVISVFLGTCLTDVLEILERTPREMLGNFENGGTNMRPSYVSKSVDPILDINLNCLPQVPRDLTDRNRTSPFAFTGNKFEFRAVGSKQLPYFPMTLLNAAVAESLGLINKELKQALGEDPLSEEQRLPIILGVIQEHVMKSKNVRFEGNNYSDEWLKRAKARGIAVSKGVFVSNYNALMDSKNRDVLVGQKIFSKEELASRYRILMEKYAMDIMIECDTLYVMMNSMILPELLTFKKYLIDIIGSALKCGIADVNVECEKAKLKLVTKEQLYMEDVVKSLESSSSEIKKKLDTFTSLETAIDFAESTLNSASRVLVDVEDTLPSKLWPFPNYYDILF